MKQVKKNTFMLFLIETNPSAVILDSPITIV